jgi:hypothetical protein
MHDHNPGCLKYVLFSIPVFFARWCRMQPTLHTGLVIFIFTLGFVIGNRDIVHMFSFISTKKTTDN